MLSETTEGHVVGTAVGNFSLLLFGHPVTAWRPESALATVLMQCWVTGLPTSFSALRPNAA